jgi:hypothetical protein
VAGVTAQAYDSDTAFLTLAVAGVAAVLTVALAMPETRPAQEATSAA